MAGFEQGYALIVGIANYPNVRPLPPTVVKDAKDIAAMLQRPDRAGYPADHVKLLINEQATKQGVLDGLKWLADNAKGDATATFYFSGHGANLPDGPNKSNYLVTYDTVLTGKPNYVNKDTILSGEELTAALNNIQTQKVIAFLEGCPFDNTDDMAHSLMSFDNSPDVSTHRKQAEYCQIILASSKSDENSYIMPKAANSLFTQCLLEAFDGKAKHDGDGMIRILDIVSYVCNEVPKRQSKQHPTIKTIGPCVNFAVSSYVDGFDQTPNQHTSYFESLDQVQLRDLLVERMSFEEIRILSKDIEAEIFRSTSRHETIEIGQGTQSARAKSSVAQMLIAHLDRRKLLVYLINELNRRFPEDMSMDTQKLNSASEVALRDFIAEHYTLQQMEVLCVNVAARIEQGTERRFILDLDTLGVTHSGRLLAAQILVEHLNRRYLTSYLVDVLRDEFPDEVPGA
jgi:hypothetical protein